MYASTNYVVKQVDTACKKSVMLPGPLWVDGFSHLNNVQVMLQKEVSWSLCVNAIQYDICS